MERERKKNRGVERERKGERQTDRGIDTLYLNTDIIHYTCFKSNPLLGRYN